jgi:hypothetical protein
VLILRNLKGQGTGLKFRAQPEGGFCCIATFFNRVYVPVGCLNSAFRLYQIIAQSWCEPVARTIVESISLYLDLDNDDIMSAIVQMLQGYSQLQDSLFCKVQSVASVHQTIQIRRIYLHVPYCLW